MMDSQNPKDNCNCNAFNSKTLKNGCRNFLSLGWNNPTVKYEELSQCPEELKMSPPCWKDNGGKWPSSPPATCARPGLQTKKTSSSNKSKNDKVSKPKAKKDKKAK